MVDDREPSVDSVRSIGAELVSQIDETDKQQVETQISDLSRRWDQLTQFTESRQQALDHTIQVYQL